MTDAARSLEEEGAAAAAGLLGVAEPVGFGVVCVGFAATVALSSESSSDSSSESSSDSSSSSSSSSSDSSSSESSSHATSSSAAGVDAEQC